MRSRMGNCLELARVVRCFRSLVVRFSSVVKAKERIASAKRTQVSLHWVIDCSYSEWLHTTS